ncbi:MAG: hypothetical protein ACLP50_20520 [Solirubrobacteraceae bacterium]
MPGEARKLTRRGIPLLVLGMLLAGAPAQARAAGLDLRQAPSAVSAIMPGLPSAAPSASALSAALQSSTGLTASEVTSAQACPDVAPGTARCDAEVIVLRSDHRPVHTHPQRRASFTQVFPRHQSAIASVTPAGATGSPPPAAATPAWLQQAYDLTYLSQTGGVGDTVAIVDAYDDPNAAADLAVFRSQYGLPACPTANGCFAKVNENGQSSPLPAGDLGWESEESLDIDAVSSLCPNCRIVLVEANSSSFSDLESAEQTAASTGARQITNSWSGAFTSPPMAASQFTFPGVAVIASTGDCGYIPQCTSTVGADAYPAGLPNVTAAGGTTVTAASGGDSARGFSESAWSLNSDGWGGSSGCDLQEPKPSYQTDVGCTGRSYADLSADADPDTGLLIYDSGNGGWEQYGGTSLASPLIAADEAVTGVPGSSPGWAYSDSALLNDPSTGSVGTCPAEILYICSAGVGYDGPTGVGSISGDVVAGAPGIGGPAVGNGSDNTYTSGVSGIGATLTAGIYPNGLDTTYYWQYGRTTGYGQQTRTTDIGSGQTPVWLTTTVTALAPSTSYHYRLVAVNSDGTTYGYDYQLTTLTAGDVPPLDSTLPAITGTPTQDQTLSASTGSWTPDPTGFTYAWERCPASDIAISPDCSQIGTGSAYKLTAADVGSLIGVAVTATSAGGQATVDSPLTVAVTGRPLTNLVAPSIGGDPQVPQTLSANLGTWSVPVTGVAYIWDRCDSDGVSGCASIGTGSSYTLSGADGEHTIVLVADVSSPGQTADAQSPALTVTVQPLPQNTVIPGISGTPQRGGLLTATTGQWTNDPTVLSYQWEDCDASAHNCQAISGATASTYTLVRSDEGGDVAVVVTARNSAGSAAATAAAVGPIAAVLPVNTTPPTIQTSSAVIQQGVTLDLTGQVWRGTPDTTYSDTWERCDAAGASCQAISGATATQYMLTAADAGSTVVAVSTATNADGPVSADSRHTAVVQPAAPRWKALPILSTDPGDVGDVGDVLSITAGVWTGSAVTTDTVQLMRCTNLCVTDGSSNTSTYAITKADIGSILRIEETAANGGGATVVWSSHYVGPVMSATSATAIVSAGRATLRDRHGTALATAQVSGAPVGVTAERARAGQSSAARTLALHRAPRLKGKLVAWACPATIAASGAPGACSAKVTIAGSTTVRLPASLTGRVRIVVVRKGATA